MFEMIMTFVICALVALIIIGLGIYQLKSKKPVGFYSGETPPAPEELTNVKAWNQKHGMMWVIYGIIIIVSSIIGCMMGDTILSVIPFCGGMILPLLVMIWYHHQLVKRYRK